MVKVEKNFPFTYADVDRHGNLRVYFRRKGLKKIRLRSPIGSVEFDAEYREALRGGETETPKLTAAAPNTWKWLCLEYMNSAAFRALDALNTQRPRRGILESTWAEPIEPESKELIGDCPLKSMSARVVRVLRDRKASTPGAANNRLKSMSAVFEWALADEIGGVVTNFARDVPRLRGRPEGFHTWSEDEAAKYETRWPIGTPERLALGVLRYLGVRRSDVVRLGKQHLRDDGSIKFPVYKGRKRNPTTLELPVLPELKAILDASPTGDLTFLVTSKGLPFSDAGFGNWFREKCDKAGLPQCSAHGLRKLAATSFAYAGATPHQLMAWFGWKSLKQAELYTRAAEQKRLAGSLGARG